MARKIGNVESGNSWSTDNGFGDVEYREGGTYIREGTHRVRVNLVAGVGAYTLYPRVLQESIHSVWNDNYDLVFAVASILVEPSIATDMLPEITECAVTVHHSPVCNLGLRCYQLASVTGSWNQPTKLGTDCGVAQTSDGGTSGAFSLLADAFYFGHIGANARVVGIEVKGEYRTVAGGARGDTLTLKAHIGTYDAGRAGKTLAYPISEDWTAFTAGGNGDFWDYTSTDAETGIACPTATGSSLNTLAKLEILGSNQSSVYYEFRKLKMTYHYCEVCDGL